MNVRARISRSAGGLPDVFVESFTNSPAIETIVARNDTTPTFRQDDVPGTQAFTPLFLMVPTASSPLGFMAGRAGTIMVIAARTNAAITAGVASLRITKNGVQVGAGVAAGPDNLTMTSGTTGFKVLSLDNQVPFIAGDLIGINLSTVAMVPAATTEFYASLFIRWSPS
jgi:hypothetical protein